MVGETEPRLAHRNSDTPTARHVHRALAATKHRAQGYHQKLIEGVQTSIPGSRVLQTFPARSKLLQGGLPQHDSHASG
jgi:hypothetical protein